LTSQIFANVYLNEFDRYVRHELKPLAYVRYGDDFILFMGSQKEALHVQSLATTWLSDQPRLTVHQSNNAIIRPNQGIYFLGHQIYPLSSIAIDGFMTQKINQKIDRQNAGSYQSMRLSKKQAKQLPWLLR
jgi:hypothetical protein